MPGLDAVVQLGSACLLLAQYAYDHSIALYRLVTRSILWIRNQEIEWRAVFEFYDPSPNALQDLLKRIRSEEPSLRRWAPDSEEVILDLGANLTMRAKMIGGTSGFDEDESCLFVETMEVRSGFRNGLDIIDRLHSIAVNQILPVANSSAQKFSVTASFTGMNPFLGFYARQLRITPGATMGFSLTFSEDLPNVYGRVDVSSDSVKVVCRDTASFQRLARKYLTLSALDLSAPQTA